MAKFDKALTVINTGGNLPQGYISQVALYTGESSDFGIAYGEFPLIPCCLVDGQQAYFVCRYGGEGWASRAPMTDLKFTYKGTVYYVCTGYNYTESAYSGNLIIPVQTIYSNDSDNDYEPPTGIYFFYSTPSFYATSGTAITVQATGNAFALQEGAVTSSSSLSNSSVNIYIRISGSDVFSGTLTGGGAGHESERYYLNTTATTYTTTSAANYIVQVGYNNIKLMPRAVLSVYQDITIKVG